MQTHDNNAEEQNAHLARPIGFFLNFNPFFNIILNLTLSVFLKLTLLAAPIALAWPNACAAPCMVARQRADVARAGLGDC